MQNISAEKKRWGRAFILFMIVVMLSVISLQVVNAYFLVHTGTPIINVKYQELPVNVINYSLYSSDTGITFGIYPISPLNLNDEFNFTTQYLLNGVYTFYILAEDTDNNLVEKTEEFEVDHGGFKVWLTDPVVGIGKTNPYNITVQSQVPAFCKYGMTFNPSCNSNLSCLFLSLSDPFTQTGYLQTHRIIDFNANLGIYTPRYVMCMLNATTVNPDDEQSYGGTNFMTGYDPTAVSITAVQAIPQPVIDRNNKMTTLYVNTSEESVCHIRGGNPLYPLYNIDRWLDGNNRSDFSSYAINHSTLIDYSNLNTNLPLFFRYNITCYNYAQWNATQSYPIEVNFNDTIMITQLTPSMTGDQSLYYEVMTNLFVFSCSFSLNGGASITMNAQDVGQRHWQSDEYIYLTLGTNNISVTCVGEQTRTQQFTIILDNVEPVMRPIDLNSATCGLEGFSFTMNATDAGTGISYYEYRIDALNSNTEIVSWTETTATTINFYPTGGLTDGETYRVTVRAYDGAGLVSSEEYADIDAEAPSSINCDFTDPTIAISASGEYGAEVIVVCEDNVGCEEYFEYAIIDEINSDCGLVEHWDTGYASGEDYDPVYINPNEYSEITFCARVYDLHHNFAEGSLNIDLNLPECGNGIIENVNIPGYEHFEVCDENNFSGMDCTDFGTPRYVGGLLICSEDCEYILEDNCDDGSPTGGYCGDNEINQFRYGYNEEQCDGTLSTGDWGQITSCQDFGFTGGQLSCNPPSTSLNDMCKFNTSRCTLSSNPLSGCGGPQGMLNIGEQCDTLRQLLNCSDFDGFVGGEIFCDNDCRYNIDGCESPIPPPNCSNNISEPGEDCQMGDDPITCDYPYTTGMMECVNCQWDDSTCGYATFCGDGVKQSPNDEGIYELCDRNDFGTPALTCNDFGEEPGYPDGYLRCNDDCTVNTDNCDKGNGYCGDDIINQMTEGSNPEQCDNDEWGQIRGCSDFGFSGGQLSCNPHTASFDDMCKFNTSRCTSPYGNGVCGGGDIALLNIGEQCDDMTQPLECSDFDTFGGGNIFCSGCRYDINGCTPPLPLPECGNGGIPEDGEDCEIGDTISCTNIGPYISGTATCFPPNYTQECQWNTTLCEIPTQCGDGIKDYDELCDGLDFGGLTCMQFGDPRYLGGYLSCDSACNHIYTDNCKKTANDGYCGDGILNQYEDGNVEQCDGTFETGDWGDTITGCQNFGFTGGTLSCNTHTASLDDMCKFNTSRCTLNTPIVPGCGAFGGVATIEPGEQCDIDNAPLECEDFDTFGTGPIYCNGCRYDLTGCEPPVPVPECGDGIKDAEEECDGDDPEPFGCEEYSDIYIGGMLSCGEDCAWDESGCIYSPSCGNNQIEEGEKCDGTDFTLNGHTVTCSDFGFIGGELQCNGCDWNTENCDRGYGYCGNNEIDNVLYEQCDGTLSTGDWGGIDSCEDFGFSGGALRCKNYTAGPGYACTFDTSLCTPRVPNNLPYCDALSGTFTTTLDRGEQCELTKTPLALGCTNFDSYTGGNISCSNTCNYDITACLFVYDAECGNNLVEPGEQCEGTETKDCSEFGGYIGGTATCSPNTCLYNFGQCIPEPECGNGIAEGNEQCDRNDVGLLECEDFIGYIGGTLGCNDDCTFAMQNCDQGYGFCGDGIINNFPLEQCDGSMWGQINSCSDFGFIGGQLSCNGCLFDTSRCTATRLEGTCMDNHLNPGEQCEPGRNFNATCSSFDHFNQGYLTCGGDCIFDISNCDRILSPDCGNGIIDAGEQCDGTNMGEMTQCSQIEPGYYISGALSCNAPGTELECFYDMSSCVIGGVTPYCGDGIVNNFPNEECDGTNLNGLSCSDLGFTGGTLSCSSCQFDTSLCATPNGGGYCGDGEINPGEECDPNIAMTLVCEDIDSYTSGYITCISSGSNECTFDITHCIPPETPGFCGDGIRNNLEECDGEDVGLMECTDIDNFIDGNLGCNDDCTFNKLNCDRGYGFCGDGIINNFPLEQCDGTNWGSIIDGCSDFGFTGGYVSCSSSCQFDTSECTNNAPPGYCGNDILNPGEQCEANRQTNFDCTYFDHFTSGQLSCINCMFDVSSCYIAPEPYCGDEIIQPGETCDGSNLGQTNLCSELDSDFISGYLSCHPSGSQNECLLDTSDCVSSGGDEEEYCGDGIVNNFPNEECDGTNLNGLLCSDLGFTAGTLSCSSCQFDTSLCATPNGGGYCGDGEINPGEECDSNLPLSISCHDIDNFQGGTLSCISSGSNECTFDITNCIPPQQPGFCGDGIRNNYEQCDGSDIPLSCTEIDMFIGGTLGCNDDCTFAVQNCDRGYGFCGDGIINNFPLEQCDGTNWGSIIDGCSDFGFSGGTLACNECVFDTSRCTGNPLAGYCGDDILNIGEQCEPNRPILFECSDFDHFTSGDIVCGPDCEFDIGQCYIQPDPQCGNGIIEQGETCDGSNLGEETCITIDERYSGGQLSCYPSGSQNECLFNTNQCVLPPEPEICGNGVVDNYPYEECDGQNINGLTCNDLGFNGGTLSCYAPNTLYPCQFNTLQCLGITGVCGDGTVNPGEDCEPGQPLNIECSDIDNYQGGVMTCNINCTYNSQQCIEPPQPGYCGDGAISGFEQCDGTNVQISCQDINGFVGGELLCYPAGGTSECMWDTSDCDLGYGFCGDGMINNFPNEQCDGSAWGQIVGCSDFGLTGSGLVCDSDCQFDTSSCVGVSGGFCGDGVINIDEQCESSRPYTASCTDFDSFISGNLNCIDCTYDLSSCNLPTIGFCGDGIVSGLEQCDGNNLGVNTQCSDFDTEFIGGTVGCHPSGDLYECEYDLTDCELPPIVENYCGDGVARGTEQCDGYDLRISCSDINGFVGGSLSCFDSASSSACMWNTENCDAGHGFCGDGMINNFPNEQCDGSTWGQIVGCSDFGLTGSGLVCDSDCQFDTSACNGITGSCGDGVINIDEQCESSRPYSASCSDFDSFIGGNLNCVACTYDLNGCDLPTQSVCGDGIISGLEECDGTNLNGISCTDFDTEIIGGTLRCYAQGTENECQYDLSQCISEELGYCGDSIINNFPNEECDGSNWGEIIGCSDFGFTGGILSCSNCDFNTASCTTPNGEGFCGDNEINPNEECEPLLAIAITCQDLGFASGTIGCYNIGQNACSIDISGCQPYIYESVCGDGVATGLEQCDMSDMRNISCADIDDFIGGILSCYPEDDPARCYWNTENCDVGYGYCGDNKINSFPNEQCDGTDWGEITSCQDFGFTGGTLRCDGCQFDTTSCTARVPVGICGDRVINPGEECESGVTLALGCIDFDGFINGTISCDYDTCTYDISSCMLPTESVCGDGMISGREQCDGNNLGDIDYCTDVDDRFIDGDVSCTSRCRLDLDECVLSPDIEAECNNGVVEMGEQCDSGEILLDCTDFALSNGFLTCNNDCSVDTTSCLNILGLDNECGNGILEPDEQCDGTVSEAMSQFYTCMNGVVCTADCSIECALPGSNEKCYNTILDQDETDTDCGGSCAGCDVGMKCVLGSDCSSNNCVEGVCALDHCMNGEIDGAETSVDCGGDCEPCGSGLPCNYDTDCASGPCVEGVCKDAQIQESEPKNPLGIALLITGLVFVVGGAGYIIYVTYFKKKKVSYSGYSSYPLGEDKNAIANKTLAPQAPSIFQSKKFEQKVAQNAEKRKSLMSGFEENASELRKISERNPDSQGTIQKSSGADNEDEDGFVSLEDLKSKKSSDSAISKLEQIVKPEEKSDAFEEKSSTSNKKSGMGSGSSIISSGISSNVSNDSNASSKDSSDKSLEQKKVVEDAKILKEKVMKKKSKNSGIDIKHEKRLKKESSTFKKLRDVNTEDIGTKISSLSQPKDSSNSDAQTEKSIKSILKNDSISHENAMALFANFDREKFMSKEFSEVISGLLKNGKISKETVSSMLFENIANGTISKRDAAKILSGLKLI